MRRNLELIRKLILSVEESPSPGEILDVISLDGYTEEEVGYHSYLLIDAGLAKGVNIGSLSDMHPNWTISHLTWAGHDFADAARNASRWAQAMNLIKTKAGDVTFDVLKQVLVILLKKTLADI